MTLLLMCALCTVPQNPSPGRIVVPLYEKQLPIKRDRKLEWRLLHPPPGALE